MAFHFAIEFTSVETGFCTTAAENSQCWVVQRPLKATFQWYEKSARQGHWLGQLILGDLYFVGFGVQKDEAEAVRWFRKAAEQNYAVAQTSLGNCYSSGTGVAKDEAEAVLWYRKAAEQNQADAQNSLGHLYFIGTGVTKDEAEAVRWFRKAAEQNHAVAQANLGNCFNSGTGVAKDEAEAVLWYRKAAEQNQADAQNILGNIYSSGGVRQCSWSGSARRMLRCAAWAAGRADQAGLESTSSCRVPSQQRIGRFVRGGRRSSPRNHNGSREMPIRNAPAPPINKKVKSVAEATIMAMNKMIEEKQLEDRRNVGSVHFPTTQRNKRNLRWH